MNVLTLDCCMLLGTLVWHCELKKREADLSEMGVFLKYKQQSNSFNKVISHSNSAKSSIYKTVSLSMGYRLWMIECSNWNPYMVRCTPHKKDQSPGRVIDFSSCNRHSYYHRLKQKPDKLFWCCIQIFTLYSLDTSYFFCTTCCCLYVALCTIQ